jgi:tetratricopeptide (TPR) repeat protein
MFSRSSFSGLFVLIACCALVPGCRTRLGQALAYRGPNTPHIALTEEPDDKDLEKTAEAHAHYAAGVIAEMNQHPDAALEEFYQAAINDPTNENLAIDLSRKLLQNKQPERAIELLTKSSDRPKASAAIFAQLGLALAQAGKTDQAIAANRTAIKRDPLSLVGYQNLYILYSQIGKQDEAMKVLDQAAARPDGKGDFYLGISEMYQNLAVQVPSRKDAARAGAIAALKRADKAAADNSSFRLRLADSYAALGDEKRASQLYLEVLKDMPDVPLLRERIHAKLTDIYLRDKDRKKAMEQLQAIVRDNPSNPQAYYFLGSIAFEDNHLPEAVDYYNKAIALNRNFEQAYYDLALTQLSLNKNEDALSTLDTARKKFGENFISEFWTGMAYSHQKDYKTALRYFTSAEIIARNGDAKRLTREFYFQAGAAAERSGDISLAEKYFQKALELSPDFPEAENYLGYMWAEHGMNLDKAKDLVEKAVKAEPKNAAYLDSLAWVYYKMDQPKEGLEYMLKAVELNPEPDATLFEHLGDIYAALKQPDKAREAWQKSLSIEPNEAVRKKLEPVSAK